MEPANYPHTSTDSDQRSHWAYKFDRTLVEDSIIPLHISLISINTFLAFFQWKSLGRPKNQDHRGMDSISRTKIVPRTFLLCRKFQRKMPQPSHPLGLFCIFAFCSSFEYREKKGFTFRISVNGPRV